MTIIARRSRPLMLAAALVTLLGVLPTSATHAARHDEPPPPAATVRIGVFNRTLPALAGAAQGFFAEQNLTVQYLQVSSSSQQFTALRNGEYDLIHSATDNWANYRLNPSNATGSTFDVQGVIGIDYAQNLALVGKRQITRLEDLRGKTLGVDVANSGFAYVAYKMLADVGLEKDEDYRVVEVGGNPIRYGKLIDPANTEFDATLLNAGFETRAANQGFPIIKTVQEEIQPYFGAFAGGRESWMTQHRSEVVRYIAAYLKASQWAFDPANKEAALALLMAQPNTPRPLAEQLYALQLEANVGLIQDLGVDRLGLYNVLALRAEFDGYDTPLKRRDLVRLSRPAGGLYTLDYLKEARRLVNHQR